MENKRNFIKFRNPTLLWFDCGCKSGKTDPQMLRLQINLNYLNES